MAVDSSVKKRFLKGMLVTREEAESKPFPPLRVQLFKMAVLIAVLFGTIAGVMNLFGP